MCVFLFIYIYLREVGPSRKILHARGMGSGRRKTVTRVVGTLGALGETKKIIITIYELHFLPLQRPLFLAPRMRTPRSYPTK